MSSQVRGRRQRYCTTTHDCPQLCIAKANQENKTVDYPLPLFADVSLEQADEESQGPSAPNPSVMEEVWAPTYPALKTF